VQSRLGQGLNLDVGVVTGERAQVVRVPGGDDAAAEADCGGDDERINRVARVEAVTMLESACLPGRRLPESAADLPYEPLSGLASFFMTR
jgi:hypothetical protein